jgi:hypothetical protein
MPGTRAAQLALAKRWIEVLLVKYTAWRIPEEMVLRFGELSAEAEALQNRVDNPEGTKGDAARARTAFHELFGLFL